MSNYQANAYFIITLPIEMANSNYQALAGFATKTAPYHAGTNFYLLTDNYTTTTFNYAARGGDSRNYKVSSLWQVSGMSARGSSQQTRYIIKY